MSFLFNFGQRVVAARSSNIPLFYNFANSFSTKITTHSLLTNYTTQKNVFQNSHFHSHNMCFTIAPSIGNISIRFKSYKIKTHSGAKKRFRALGNGKFKRSKAGKRHLNTGISRSKIRRLSKPAFSNSSQINHLKKLMPYA